MSKTKLGEVALLQAHGDLLKHSDRFDPAPLVQAMPGNFLG